MKKINNLELSSIIIIQIVSLYLGININIIKSSNGVNGWLIIILSNILGIIPLLLYLYISKYKPNIPLNQKIISLYGKIGKILNIILSIIIIIIGFTILYNNNNFITSQLLYRTPRILLSIIIILVAIYLNSKGIKCITRVSFILLVFNIIIFLISFISLSVKIDIDNFLPFLKEDNQNILLTSLKITSISIFPILITLCIPKESVAKPDNYTKDIIKAYIIGTIISSFLVIITYGVLGITLVNLFEFPEYIVIKKLTLFGFLERVENIVSNQWIASSFIYLTFIIYYLNTTISIKKINPNILNIIFGIILVITPSIIFKNNTMFHEYTKNIFPYITMSLIFFYLIISIKIYIDKLRQKDDNHNLQQ